MPLQRDRHDERVAIHKGVGLALAAATLASIEPLRLTMMDAEELLKRLLGILL
jgi:hypothetical protein